MTRFKHQLKDGYVVAMIHEAAYREERGGLKVCWLVLSGTDVKKYKDCENFVVFNIAVYKCGNNSAVQKRAMNARPIAKMRYNYGYADGT
ncbi:Uncharacterised protein [Chlamydia trachomatis]|nr:Uncharacterised protein [Chlamydia trachomatis]